MIRTTWDIDIARRPKLREDLSAEICIIGGGLAGMWCAYLLSKEGKSVVLIERDRIGKGETVNTTAFLNEEIDTDLSDLIRMFGKKNACLIWRSHRDAIERIERVVKEEGIECEFRRASAYTYANDEKEFEDLKEESKLIQECGFEVELHRNPKFGFDAYGVLELKKQGMYHPMKFFRALAEAAERNGARIYEQTEAVKVRGKNFVKVETKNGSHIVADQVIIATYAPLNNKSTHFKKGMYTSYVYELSMPHGVIREGMYMDMANPYHYIRVDPREGAWDRVIIGGEDHRSELDKIMKNKSFKALKDYIDSTFSHIEHRVERKWLGGILEPSDGLALIGEIAPSQYVASAFSGNGMTYSSISGALLTDLILGRKNEYKKLYDPRREMKAKALAIKARDYGEEFVRGVGKNIFK